MSTTKDWVRGYARQADVDLHAHELYANHPVALAAECHKLLFLQMACEKVCKSYLIRGGAQPWSVQSSHAHIAGPLPGILRQRMLKVGYDARKIESLVTKFRHIAREIELLNPAVDDAGKRPSNCEYPWPSGDQVITPRDHRFEISRLLLEPAGVTFRKRLRDAINTILVETGG